LTAAPNVLIFWPVLYFFSTTFASFFSLSYLLSFSLLSFSLLNSDLFYAGVMQQQRLLGHTQGRSQGRRAPGASYVEGGRLASPQQWCGGGVTGLGEAEAVGGGMARLRRSTTRNFDPGDDEDDHDHERRTTTTTTSGAHRLLPSPPRQP
jgi:hypothetical protein